MKPTISNSGFAVVERSGFVLRLLASRPLALLPLALLPIACSSGPLSTPEASRLAAELPIPRSMLVRVKLVEKDFVYGNTQEWEEGIREIFREKLDVCERVLAAGEDPATADVVVDVTIESISELSREVDTQGAVLEVMAWVTVPLLPLWIDDVKVKPGISISVAMNTLGEKSADTNSVPLSSVTTHMLERYEFFSWPTLGAVLLPPFVYQAGHPEHMEESIASEVRVLAALEIAKLIKGSDRSSELIRSIQSKVLDGNDLEISMDYGAGLGKVMKSVGKETKRQESSIWRNSNPFTPGKATITVTIDANHDGFLHLRAVRAVGSGSVLYTIALPSAWPVKGPNY